MSAQQTHGVGGWILDDFEWDFDTGVARFEYLKYGTKNDLLDVCYREQPCSPDHQGWDKRQIEHAVLALDLKEPPVINYNYDPSMDGEDY